MLDSVIASSGIDPKDKRFPKGEVLADIFSFAINTGQSIEQVLVMKYPYFLELARRNCLACKSGMRQRKKPSNSVDFDDLLEKPLRLLEKDAALARILPAEIPIRPRR